MTTAAVVVRPMGSPDSGRVIAIADSLTEAPRWAPEVYEAALNPDGVPRRIALVGEDPETGIAVGFAIAAVVGPEAELESIGVAREWQRKGVGGRLLGGLMAMLDPLGVTEVFLEVRDSNWAAQQLYRCCGFEETGRRPGYYADPKEDAVVMRLLLGSS